MAPDRSLFMRGGQTGILLIHGLGGTPLELKSVANGLHGAGCTVHAVQLPGHCGTESDLAATSWRDWSTAVEKGFWALQRSCTKVFVGGLSMGAILALQFAQTPRANLAGLLLYAPTLFYDGWSVRKQRWLMKCFHPLIGTRLGRRYRFVEREPFGVKDERIRALIRTALASGDSAQAGVEGTPAVSLRELYRLASVTRRRLGDVCAPALIIHPREDDVSSLRNVHELQRALAGPVETLVLNDSYHLITLDRQRHLVTQRSIEFVEKRIAEMGVEDQRPRQRKRAARGSYFGRVSYMDPKDWNQFFPDEAESHEYYSACESAQRSPRMGAVGGWLDDRLAAVAPAFSMRYRLDVSLQSRCGFLARVGRRVASRLSFPIVCMGSPFAERCHIGLRPDLDAQERGAAIAALVDGLELRARHEKVSLVAVKDILGMRTEEISSVLAARGYVRLPSLPVAVLDLTGMRDVDGYLATLSSGTRRDLRRKLRSASAVRLEDRHDISDVHAELMALYQSVRAESRLDYGDFEELPEDYFAHVADQLGERALFRLYWVGSTLAAFNLLFIEKERIIDKFLGMRYPLAREHNLYALSWIENVRLCLSKGVRTLQTGQTAYAEKMRLGSHLVPSSVWFRHRSPRVHGLLRVVAPWASFDRNDPALARTFREASA